MLQPLICPANQVDTQSHAEYIYHLTALQHHSFINPATINALPHVSQSTSTNIANDLSSILQPELFQDFEEVSSSA